LVEETYDRYAQDKDGNVWYLEDSKKIEDGEVVSTAGSWEAGVDGAKTVKNRIDFKSLGSASRSDLAQDDGTREPGLKGNRRGELSR